jgi:hypothetical protein
MKSNIDIYSDNIQLFLNKNIWNAQILGSVDNSENIDQELKLYDSLARVFSNVLSPCAAAIQNKTKDTVYLSYNSDKTALYKQHKAVIELLEQKCLNSDQLLSNKDKPLIGLILFFQYKNNIYFKNAIKNACKNNKEFDAKSIQSSYQKISNKYFKKNKSQGANEVKLDKFIKNSSEDLESFVNCYKEIITHDNTEESIKIELTQPLIDLYKVNSFFLEKNIKAEFIEGGIGHAELNVLFYIEKEQIETSKQYIGVSKPCCFLCNETIQHKEFQVAGAHNIYYKQDNVLLHIKQNITDLKTIIEDKFLNYLMENTPKIKQKLFELKNKELSEDIKQLIEETLLECKDDFQLPEKLIPHLCEQINMEKIDQRIIKLFDSELDREIKINFGFIKDVENTDFEGMQENEFTFNKENIDRERSRSQDRKQKTIVDQDKIKKWSSSDDENEQAMQGFKNRISKHNSEKKNLANSMSKMLGLGVQQPTETKEDVYSSGEGSSHDADDIPG